MKNSLPVTKYPIIVEQMHVGIEFSSSTIIIYKKFLELCTFQAVTKPNKNKMNISNRKSYSEEFG